MNPKTLFSVFLLAFLLMLGQNGFSQNIKFYATVDRDNIAVGETFLYEIVLENVEGNNMSLPDLTGFKIVQGPSTSTSISIVNGSRSSSMSYSYLLMATTKGKFNIGPTTIQIKQRTLSTNTILINVNEGNSSSTMTGIDDSKETLIRLELSNDVAYIGQQVMLNFVLYTRQNISAYNFVNEPDYTGFYAVPIQDIKEQPQRKTINGKEYHRQVLRKVALYPQKIGEFVIGPVNCTLEIPEDGGRSSFFFRDVKKEQCVANKVKVNVKNLPQPTPESFTGAVGAFNMKTSVNKNTVQTGESIVVKMQIIGDGDPKIVQAPIFKKMGGVEFYEPTLIKDETYIRADRIYMDKVFEYIFVPSNDSVYAFKPEFTYFSSETNRFETISSDPFNVNVVKGSSSNIVNNSNLKNSLLSAMVDSTELSKMDHGFFGSKPYFAVLATMLLFPIMIIYLQKKKIESETTKALDAQKSFNVALISLDRASKFMASEQAQEFYKEISIATTGYIQKKYGIANTELSIDVVKSKLTSSSVDPKFIAEYEAIQSKCEIAKFAGQYGEMQSIYKLAVGFIEQMENLK